MTDHPPFAPEIAQRIRDHALAGFHERPVREVSLMFDDRVPRGEADLSDPDIVRIHPADWAALCEVI